MQKIKYFFVLLGAALLFIGVWYLSTIVIYIVISTILALIGRPLVEQLQRIKIKNVRIGSGISAAITLLTIWVVLITFFVTFIPLVIQEGKALSDVDVNKVVENLQEPLRTVEEYYYEFSAGDKPLKEVAGERLKDFLSISNVANIFSSVTGVFGDVFVALFSITFITFFFLKEKYMLTRLTLLAIPTKYDSSALHAILSIKQLLSRYFIGLLVQLSTIFAGVTIGLSIAGIGTSHVLIIALFAALINVIPYIGPLIGYIFGITVGIVTNLDMNFYSELLPLMGYITIVFGVVQLIDNFFTQPMIFSSSVKAHPLEIFLVILSAGTLGGILGMVVAIPTYTIIRVVAKEFFSQHRFVKKLTENI